MWQGILDRVQNPLWWFDILIPVIVGIFVTTLVWPVLTRWIAKYSEWYRNRKAVVLAKQERYLEFLVSNPILLTTHNFMTVILLLLFLMMVAMLILLRVFIGFADVAESPYFKGDTTARTIAARVIMAFGALISTWIGYKAASQLVVTTRAYGLLGRSHIAKFKESKQRDTPPTQNHST
jgi:hypothetical protein